MENLVYCLSPPIKVLTNHSLKQVLQKPDYSGRLLKWAVELSQFDVSSHPWTSIKGQALADLIIECTGKIEHTEGDTHQALRPLA